MNPPEGQKIKCNCSDCGFKGAEFCEHRERMHELAVARTALRKICAADSVADSIDTAAAALKKLDGIPPGNPAPCRWQRSDSPMPYCNRVGYTCVHWRRQQDCTGYEPRKGS